MSYGVTTTWASQHGRAPAAGKRKGKSTTTRKARKKSGTSAPRAKKKRTRKKSATRAASARAARAPRARAPRARKARAKKAKAPKLYKRYDPVTGELAKVTKDDPRYDEWRKTRGTVASRKKALAKSDPLEYARTFGVKAVQQRASRAAEAAVVRSARKVAAPVSAALAPSVARFAPLALPAVVAAGTVAAGVAAYMALARNERIAAGNRINQISLAFVKSQQDVVKQLGVRSWQDVPLELRNKLLDGYKRAIADVSAGIYHAGSLRPSQEIPYGR